jgi:hypothetical protein
MCGPTMGKPSPWRIIMGPPPSESVSSWNLKRYKGQSSKVGRNVVNRRWNVLKRAGGRTIAW